jgi:hypothetical protein
VIVAATISNGRVTIHCNAYWMMSEKTEESEVIFHHIPAHGKSPGGVQKSGCKGAETSCDGIETTQLTQGVHCAVKHEADETECNQKGGGTSSCESFPGSDKQTST